jgi:preprotein translocase subunit YajC
MNSLIPDAMAQGAGAPAGGSLAPLLMMVVFIVIFYFLLIRPQQKKAKEHTAMLGKLAAGDEVVAAGGMLGKVVEVGEQFVTLEIAPNVHVKVQKFQINMLVPKGTVKSA